VDEYPQDAAAAEVENANIWSQQLFDNLIFCFRPFLGSNILLEIKSNQCSTPGHAMT
jgi:hypothetical protein